MKIKVCGITRLEDARYAAGAGADFLGFIQHRNSARYVDPRAVREILSWIHGPESAGVFVNETPDAVNEISERAGFAFAQLHGDETPEQCAEVALPVIKALSILPDTTEDDLRRLVGAYQDSVALFLFDTGGRGQHGGTGTPFDWNVVRNLAREVAFFLAGGLSAENVAEAVHVVAPYGVDVSSSLETAPGHKDLTKMDHFFLAARAAASAHL